MKHFNLTALCFFVSSVTFAASVNSTLDGGGKRATSAGYTLDGSVGGIAGISSGVGDTAKHGYIGQLSNVSSLTVTSTPATVNEGATSQLTGKATLDDSSVTVLAGSDITWALVAYPFTSISPSGVLTAAVVYANTAGPVGGSYLGVNTNTSVQVVDTNSDNFGIYAGDGLPDTWQVQYFGLNNPNAAPTADADSTGQNNLFKYVAGLDPTNSASVFVLKIANVPGQPNQKNLIFNPIAAGRTYTPEYRTNLVSGVYTNLTGYSGPQTNANQVTVTDLSATQISKFYRVRISLP